MQTWMIYTAISIAFVIIAIFTFKAIVFSGKDTLGKKLSYSDNARRIVRRVWAPKSIVKSTQRLRAANRPVEAETYILTKMIIALAPATLVFIFTMNIFATVIIFALVHIVIKEIYVESKINERKKRIDKSILPFFETLSLAIQSGAGLEKAIELTCEKVDESILVEEFRKVLADAKYGTSLEEALFALGERIPSYAVSSTISSIINSLEIGAPMSVTIKREMVRTRQNIIDKAEEAAAKSGTKILIPLVLTMLPALIILLIGPAIIRAMGQLGS